MKMESNKYQFFSLQPELANRAFLAGDAVKVFFYISNSKLIMLEECYFFLMASMRKMRMKIPLEYTLEFFEDLFKQNVLNKGAKEGIITLMVYRNDAENLAKADVQFYFSVEEKIVTELNDAVELDVLKEINVNTNLLSNIRVHCPENVYAQIYAQENDLDDVILLNPDKRIARTSQGNLLFLEGSNIKIPKQSEGAYISPLLENYVTFVHKNGLATIVEAEVIAFESQKADEILLISDEKGFLPVKKIRNKEFPFERFTEMISLWKAQLI